MAQDPSSTPDDTWGSSPEEPEEAEEGRTRLPRVVVRMSDAMFEALKGYCTTHDLVATQLGRELLATKIGWDLSKDPDAPGSTTRQKYADDTQREAGKTRNKLQASLLRKALMQAHQGQMKGRPLLVATATKVVMALASGKPEHAALVALETEIDDAIKAGA